MEPGTLLGMSVGEALLWALSGGGGGIVLGGLGYRMWMGRRDREEVVISSSLVEVMAAIARLTSTLDSFALTMREFVINARNDHEQQKELLRRHSEILERLADNHAAVMLVLARGGLPK